MMENQNEKRTEQETGFYLLVGFRAAGSNKVRGFRRFFMIYMGYRIQAQGLQHSWG